MRPAQPDHHHADEGEEDNDHDDDNDDDKDKGCGNELHEYDEDDSSLRLYKKTRGLNEKGERGDMIRGP